MSSTSHSAAIAISSHDLPASKESLPSLPASIWADKYRGATVADLDPPPTLSTHPLTPIKTALFAALSHDYTHLTVVSASTRALLGYVSVPRLRALLAAGVVGEDDAVERAMLRFQRGGKHTDEDRDSDMSNMKAEAGKTVMNPGASLRKEKSKEHANRDQEGGEEKEDGHPSQDMNLAGEKKEIKARNGGEGSEEEKRKRTESAAPHSVAKKDKYQVITMDTPLEDLEAFFRGDQPDEADTGTGATGLHHRPSERDFAIVTDAGRRFVLGVATKADLEEFVRRRPA